MTIFFRNCVTSFSSQPGIRCSLVQCNRWKLVKFRGEDIFYLKQYDGLGKSIRDSPLLQTLPMLPHASDRARRYFALKLGRAPIQSTQIASPASNRHSFDESRRNQHADSSQMSIPQHNIHVPSFMTPARNEHQQLLDDSGILALSRNVIGASQTDVVSENDGEVSAMSPLPILPEINQFPRYGPVSLLPLPNAPRAAVHGHNAHGTTHIPGININVGGVKGVSASNALTQRNIMHMQPYSQELVRIPHTDNVLSGPTYTTSSDHNASIHRRLRFEQVIALHREVRRLEDECQQLRESLHLF